MVQCLFRSSAMVQCLCEEARAMGAFYCHKGAIAPLPPSPLFCMMYKSINGGGSGGGVGGGGEVVYAILKFLSQVLNL